MINCKYIAESIGEIIDKINNSSAKIPEGVIIAVENAYEVASESCSAQILSSNETVDLFIREFEKKENKDWNAEISEVKVAINNEKIWLYGSTTKEERQIRKQNICDLEEYLGWLTTENPVETVKAAG